MRKWIPLLLLVASALPLLAAPRSGLSPGDRVPAYNPRHLAGPDKGSTTCPV